MTLIIGMVGFGGMFAVYTYISTTLTDVAGLSRSLVPLALMIYGLGMVAGNLIGGRLADRALIPGLFVSMTALGVLLGIFVIASTTRTRRCCWCSSSVRRVRRWCPDCRPG